MKDKLLIKKIISIIPITVIMLMGCSNKTTQLLPQNQYQVKQKQYKHAANYIICDKCLTYTKPYLLKTGEIKNEKIS